MARVAKVIEIVGSSEKSWEDAAATAVKIASKTIQNIVGIEVQDQTASIKDGKIRMFKTTVKVAFAIKG